MNRSQALFSPLYPSDIGAEGRVETGPRATPDARARETVWFSDPPGFGFRVYPGGKRVYVVQSRMRGRPRTVTLGSASVISEFEARQLARRVLLRAQTGGVPADERLEARTAPSFADFLDEYWSRAEPRWKPSTRRTHGVYRRLYLANAFKDQSIADITQADVLAWFNATSDRAGPGGANRVFSVLAAMFARAELWGYRPEGTNPCRGVRLNRRRKMERFLSVTELGQLGAALDVEKAEFPVHTAAVKLILLSGCRGSEILGLEWDDVRGQKLLLRDSKTGPRTVWIGREGRALLDDLKKRRGPEPGIFHNPRTGSVIGTLEYYWARIRRRTGFSTLRIHDLRHTYASHAASMSEPLPMIGKLLGHKALRSTSRYTHLDDGAVLSASAEVGGAIAALLFP